jgi:hypothetical protein
MRFFEFATAVTAIGCGAGVIVSTVHQVLGGRRGRQQVALETSEERMRLQEQELAALRHQNEQLQRQLEWHARLLEQGDAQDSQALPRQRAPGQGAGRRG